MSHWFFLSYARDKDDKYLNRYLPRFYEDLNSTIRPRTARSEGEDGFFDRDDVELGDKWRDTVAEALQTSRSFVSLYSRAYFESHYCGKEWQVFSSRLTAYNADLPPRDRPSLLLPILWVPDESLLSSLPDAAAEVQFNHRDFGELYAQEGLLHLMKIDSKEYRDCYEKFVEAFAKKLIQAARPHSLPRFHDLQPLDEIESAFHSRGRVLVNPGAQTASGGPGRVDFVYVAGRKDELASVRKKVDSYGEIGGYDWQPYLPELNKEVGVISQAVAAKMDLTSSLVELHGNIIEQLRTAEERNTIVAIVVDTWTLDLPAYRNPMREYDRKNFLNCVVLVAWNHKDEELTETERLRLEGIMRETFNRNVCKLDRNCFLETNSHEELMKELSILLNEVQVRIRRQGRVIKKAEGGNDPDMPPSSNNSSLPSFDKPPTIVAVRRASA